jgi:hypothetical protein
MEGAREGAEHDPELRAPADPRAAGPTEPPCSSTSPLTIASPSPPRARARLLSACVNGWNRCGSRAGAMPSPSSTTRIRARSPSSRPG